MACCCNNRNRCNCGCNCCRKKMDECRIQPVSGCRPNSDCCWYPVDVTSDNGRQMRLCCDQSGCCGMFPEDCRNTFWPEFSHPRWLCCKDLYCARRKCGC